MGNLPAFTTGGIGTRFLNIHRFFFRASATVSLRRKQIVTWSLTTPVACSRSSGQHLIQSHVQVGLRQPARVAHVVVADGLVT